MDNFAVFILTHGRPNKVKTYNTLRKLGYTGKIYLILDNQDKTIDEYRKLYEKEIIIFNKQSYIDTIDSGDNFDEYRAVVYARNACFDIAKDLGIEYFLQLDDDYRDIRYRYDKNGYLASSKVVTKLDSIFTAVLNFYKSTNIKSLCFAQTGDFMGGEDNRFISTTKEPVMCLRKAMNSFFCSTNRRFDFFGKINEDVNMYVTLGKVGDIFLTIPNICIQQVDTQKNKGGLTDIYLKYGTYIKSLYTVLYNPSCIKITMMGVTRFRYHHRIDWKKAVPMIINEKYKKV